MLGVLPRHCQKSNVYSSLDTLSSAILYYDPNRRV